MLIGVPVAVSMAVASVLYLVVYGVAPDIIVAQRMIAGVESFPLLAVPFFILAGNLMNVAGVTGRIYAFALALVGWMRGGLAQVNIIGSVIFSGMSGTALADAAGIGTIEIKAMRDHGYPVEAAVGVTAASATLGPIFPPSLPFVIYGMMANVSIGALFMAGILPGIVMTLMMMITVAVFAHKRGWGSDTPFDIRALGRGAPKWRWCRPFRLSSTSSSRLGLSLNVAGRHRACSAACTRTGTFDFSAVMALMTPIILIGGMTMGWFTPTEGGGRGGDLVAVPRPRPLPLHDVPQLAKAGFDTIETTASVLFIVTAASIFAWLLHRQPGRPAPLRRDPLAHRQQVGVPDPRSTCWCCSSAASSTRSRPITIIVPILCRFALRLGRRPGAFRLILTLNLMIGLLHPPLGMVLFVLSRIAKLSSSAPPWRSCPWLVPLFLALIAITFIPAITLWLPTQMGTDPMNSALPPRSTGPRTSDGRASAEPLAPGMVPRAASEPAAFAAPTCTISAMRGPGDFVSARPWMLATRWPGEIVEVGGSAPGLGVGDRVAVNPSRWCGHCVRCREGRANLCENIFFMGSASKTPHMQGGFASLFDATPAQCAKVPSHVPFAAAALAEPLAVCLHAVSRAGPIEGKKVVLFGAGPIGLLAMVAAKLAGAGEVAVVDIAPAPLAFATRLGADHVVDISGSDEALKSLAAERGFDIAFEVSGTPAGLAGAIASVRRGGTVVQVGNLPGGQIPAPANAIMAKELDLKGSFRFAGEFAQAVDLIAGGKADVLRLVTAERSLSDAPDAFRLALDRSQSVKVVLTA
jgi:TRAP-type C4-dicarboxylate transport system permease large subunit/threonine dehydrogenase-like Zn-dependent dehydrogenase